MKLISPKTVLHWLWLKKEIYRLGFPYKEWMTLQKFGTLEEHLKLFEYASKSKYPIVELGSYFGKGTYCLAKGSLKGNKQPIFTIDDHEESTCEDGVHYINSLEVFKENIYGNNVMLVEPILKKSFEAAKDWNKKIGLLYIDADHSYESVKRDFFDWTPFLVKDGMVIFHDIKTREGVKQFMQEDMSRQQYFIKVDEYTNTRCFVKTHCFDGEAGKETGK